MAKPVRWQVRRSSIGDSRVGAVALPLYHVDKVLLVNNGQQWLKCCCLDVQQKGNFLCFSLKRN
jgi:hypothetical protein